jgi:hypothetical protein
MPAKSEQKEINIEVELPESGFPKCMFFNRFRIQREKDFLLLHFGMDSGTDGVLDHCSCTISHHALDQNKNSLIDYLSRLPKPKEKAPAWNKSFPIDQVDAFDIFNMSYQNEIAETVLSLYPLTVGARKAIEHSGDLKIRAHPLVLLRSSTEIQMQLIVALYEE